MVMIPQLLQRATNPREVSLIFTDYSRRILSKAIPSDPNYLKICVAVGQIEQWGENRYPSWIFMSNDTGGLRKGLPQTRDDPIAAQIGDARTRQLPSSDEVRSLQARNRGLPPPTVDDGKMSKQDIQILM
jgi:farnesyl-diphosphate farnesyltransferase